MNLRELERMHEAEQNHWWFAGKRALFKRLLRARLERPNLRILDVGSGTGAVAADFGRYGWICATDRSVDAMKLAKSRGVGAASAAQAGKLPVADKSVDLVLAFDIIEHVDDDAGVLADIARVLKPGGGVAIHVPAWPGLWSSHDEALEHKRRYTRAGLAALLASSPLDTEYLGWTNATILAPAVAMRGVRRFFPQSGETAKESDLYALPSPLNRLMRRVYDVEAAIAANTGLPFGLSLAAIATKPAPATAST